MKSIHKKLFTFASVAGLALAPAMSFAQEAAAAVTPATGAYDTIRYVLAGFAVLLLLVIVALGYAIKASLDIRKKQMMNKRKLAKASSVVLLLLSTLFGSAAFAQDAPAAATAEAVVEEPGFLGNLFATAPNDMLITILILLVELLVIFVLVRVQIKLLKEKKEVVEEADRPGFTWSGLLEKLGANKSTDDVESLDLKHDYDGIRELDNNIPKWWQFAFLGTAVISVIYIFRMFVTETLPDQITELHEDQRIAAVKMAEYLKGAANNVDENTVTMLDAGGIAQGAEIYAKNCVACHGTAGEGTIGPNLTDENWVHKGGLKDIFYSIKYGWPEKGMKSWKDDFSPMQIAQLTSYVKSLAGTNPPNAKAPEGEVYKDEAAPAADASAEATVAPAEEAAPAI